MSHLAERESKLQARVARHNGVSQPGKVALEVVSTPFHIREANAAFLRLLCTAQARIFLENVLASLPLVGSAGLSGGGLQSNLL